MALESHQLEGMERAMLQITRTDLRLSHGTLESAQLCLELLATANSILASIGKLSDFP